MIRVDEDQMERFVVEHLGTLVGVAQEQLRTLQVGDQIDARVGVLEIDRVELLDLRAVLEQVGRRVTSTSSHLHHQNARDWTVLRHEIDEHVPPATLGLPVTGR